MLNLSKQSVTAQVGKLGLDSLGRIDLPSGQRLFRGWLLAVLLLSLGILFMPWVQNFRAKGTVTALNPASRPQTIHSTIPGRIERWHVFEGDTVQRGDTILRLSEIKPEYLDPELVNRSQAGREAKAASAEAYLVKAEALAAQIETLRQERELKRRQLANKLDQSQLKVQTLQAELEQELAQVEIAEYQLRRTDSLYNQGLKSLTDLEGKRLKVQESRAKLTGVRNKLDQARTEVDQVRIDQTAVDPEYAGKIAKATSDRQSALTEYYAATGDVAKLQSQEANYRIRQGYQFVVAPQRGIVAKVLTPGLGETVKEGDPVVSILPADFRPAVEMYVEPFNLPLVREGQEVRFLFDGWPGVVFSGWPGLSYGTFVGEVVAIDNIIDSKGNYRILVAPDYEDGRPWPEALRPGSGAQGVALLGTVPVWYEIWRQLNAFPPDYYIEENTEEKEKAKTKAPAAVLAK